MNNDPVYTELAKDLIAVIANEERDFDIDLCHRLIWRSKELPTAATSDQLFTEVLEDMARKNFTKLQAFRSRKHGGLYMQDREFPALVAALKPLCDRAFPVLNVMLSVDRDYLFHPQNYIKTAGRLYYEEAPSFTFTRFLNDMERYRKVKSETYERNVPRMAEIHALNRVANIMPREFHRGFDGRLKPGETVGRMVQRERAQVWRNVLGDMTMPDLIGRVSARKAGLA